LVWGLNFNSEKGKKNEFGRNGSEGKKAPALSQGTIERAFSGLKSKPYFSKWQNRLNKGFNNRSNQRGKVRGVKSPIRFTP
jgi:hypothetical protein